MLLARDQSFNSPPTQQLCPLASNNARQFDEKSKRFIGYRAIRVYENFVQLERKFELQIDDEEAKRESTDERDGVLDALIYLFIPLSLSVTRYN